ncbi:methyl-accepting chemotaxis protein [Rhodovastum atsumiense]|uniref:HAMP domain-containing protein n=1 Tax=Rhodovastum atsumiense TaxID=504468 RepID=A0A5M6IJ01_9PROT|nr:methyl-accepting chemotaxis protein [Rhodovastum atsumiense]KAA5608234.1 HAMP domain-containing protein [Rhodovastum atsumiense]
MMTSRLANLKIASRLMIGFGLLVVFLLGISGGWTYSADASLQALRDVIRLKNNEVVNERAQAALLQGRLAIWAAMVNRDQSAFTKADDAFTKARGQLAELAASTTEPSRLAMVRELDTQVGAYAGKVIELRQLLGQTADLASSEHRALNAAMIALGDRIRTLSEPLSHAYFETATQLTSQSTENLQLVIRLAMGLGLVSVLSGVVLAVGTARSIVVPVAALTRTMRALADRDLSVAIPSLEQHDEVGEMARAVQVFKEGMVTADRLSAEREAARAAREQRTAQVEALVQDFERQAAELVNHLSSSATEMTATAGQMTQTAQQTSSQAGVVAGAANEASASVQTVASATEQLAASIGSITRQVEQSATIAHQAVEEARRSDATVRALSEAAQKIGDVVGLITTIAGQTNLLALNATIEAARAGDAGKGFAVVATEVKSLATETAKATGEIGAQITRIQAATQDAVATIGGIVRTIGQVNDITGAIAAAVKEQGSATAEIARSVQQVAQGTDEVTHNITGVSSAAAETGVASQQVLNVAGTLSKNAERLAGQVNSFITGVRAA